MQILISKHIHRYNYIHLYLTIISLDTNKNDSQLAHAPPHTIPYHDCHPKFRVPYLNSSKKGAPLLVQNEVPRTFRARKHGMILHPFWTNARCTRATNAAPNDASNDVSEHPFLTNARCIRATNAAPNDVRNDVSEHPFLTNSRCTRAPNAAPDDGPNDASEHPFRTNVRCTRAINAAPNDGPNGVSERPFWTNARCTRGLNADRNNVPNAVSLHPFRTNARCTRLQARAHMRLSPLFSFPDRHGLLLGPKP